MAGDCDHPAGVVWTNGTSTPSQRNQLQGFVNSRAVLLLSVLLGCSDAAAPSALSSLDGVWDYTGDRSVDGTPSSTCRDTGTFTFKETDLGWAGLVQSVESCRSAALVTSLSNTDSIVSGVSTGQRLTFVRRSLGRNCADTAFAGSADPNSLSGRSTAITQS